MSELNRLKVVDFTMGRSDSDEVNTNLPFADNFEKTRTIQQANVVLGAYVNRNYNEMQNKADKDEIPTKVSELENDAGYITDGDIPSKTSDLLNDGEDGEHPFITKEVDNLTNYTDTETLNTDLGLINGDIADINTNLQGLNDAIDLQLPNRIGDIVVDSIRSKNMFDGLLEIGAYSFADGTKSASTLYARSVNKIPVIAGKTYRLSYTTSQTISDYGFVFFNNNTYVSSIQGTLTVTIPSGVNYVVFNLGTYPSDFDLSAISKVQFELGSTVTPYRPYQQLNDFDFDNVSITRNTTYITNQGYTRVIKYGKICIGYFNVRLTGNIADNTVLISGLPQCYFERFGFSSAGSNNQGFRFYIDNTGNIHADGAISFEGWVAGNFIFPIK